MGGEIRTTNPAERSLVSDSKVAELSAFLGALGGPDPIMDATDAVETAFGRTER